MLKLPYGESNFTTVIKDGYFYQDRTAFIRDLETAPKFVYYLRPRRFGKSLFVSMLEHYYGLEFQNQFDDLFGKLAIGKKPTPLANKYLILKFQFSGINTNTPENTQRGFLKNVRDGVSVFLKEYIRFFPQEIHADILGQEWSNEVVQQLFNHYKLIRTAQDLPKIYVLIDEYDHFTNELISFNFDFFAKSVTENGFVRKFYEVLKIATWDGVVDRIFITGVSPVTVDSMTSGFNIGTNLSLHPNFHSMMGFIEKEVAQILRGIGVKKINLTNVLDDLRAWYDGYLFHIDAKSHVYNPNMVLSFAVYYQATKTYPDDMLDSNIASDYTKIRNIFKIQQREDEHLNTLRILTDTGEVSAVLTKEFSLAKDFEHNDLVSLLFYMGFLTIQAKELGSLIFTFPNYAIEKLYAQYFISIIKQKTGLPIDNNQLNFAIRELALWGTPQYKARFCPFLTKLSIFIKKSLNLQEN
jgi:Predicted AAA-ATPase